VRLPFPATYPAYPGEDPAERSFTVVRIAGSRASRDLVAISIDSHHRRRFFLRLVDEQPDAEIHADGTVKGPPATVFTAVYGEVECGSGWRREAVPSVRDRRGRPVHRPKRRYAGRS
jgi:hypothetical protein